MLIKFTTSKDAAPHPSVSAAEVAGNTDLITEILLRLPIKSLIRFKSVSKLWLSLISDPKFSHRRSPSHASPSGLFLDRYDYEYDMLDFSIGHNPNPFESILPFFAKISQSCNGLLMCFPDPDPDPGDPTRDFYVFNPTTKYYTTLPPLPRETTYMSIAGMTLAFDPSKSPHYKVICVINDTEDSAKFEIEIYSSETGRWRPSSLGFFETGLDTLFERGVYWNGCVHWISRHSVSLRFEVEEEQVRPMLLPPVPESLEQADMTSGYFGESRDRLHFVDHFPKPDKTCFKVYESERDYSGWFVKYVFYVFEVSREFPEMIWRYDSHDEYIFSVLYVVRCEIDEDSFLVMNIPGGVFRYRFEDATFCKLLDFPIEERYRLVLKHCEAHQYIESIAYV